MKKIFIFTWMLFSFLNAGFAQYVGIGTVSPTDKLHIDSGNVHLGKLVWDPSRNYNFLKFGDGAYVFLGEDETDDRMVLYAKDFIFHPSSGYNGCVGIGTNYTPVSPLEIFNSSPNTTSGLRLTHPSGLFANTSWNIYGSGLAPYGNFLLFAMDGADKAYIDGFTGLYFTISDRNLKKNINYFPESGLMQKIMALKPAHYQMKENTAASLYQMGFISQDVEKIFPELVSDVNGIKMMNYSGFIPVAIAGIKEEQEEIETLKKENAELRERLDKLEKKVLNK